MGAASDPLDTVATIETPEHVRFRYRLAGPMLRAIAYGLDLLIRAAVGGTILVILAVSGWVDPGRLDGASLGVALVLFFVLEWGYFVLTETLMSGQSPGKRAVGIRVVTAGGRPLGFLDSALRNLLRAADFLPTAYALGFVVMLRDRSFRRLGDMVAATLVISERRSEVGSGLELVPPPTAAELASLPPLPELSASELEAIAYFLHRCRALGLLRQHELAEILAPGLAKRFHVRYADPVRFLGVLYFRVMVGRHGHA